MALMALNWNPKMTSKIKFKTVKQIKNNPKFKVIKAKLRQIKAN